ncbi:MAG: hypothetical protein HUJ66_06095, partial [Oscillospiraceae bacterium]|nr:hypothetical protein [Oscillospiraceae bacterium]
MDNNDFELNDGLFSVDSILAEFGAESQEERTLPVEDGFTGETLRGSELVPDTGA